MGKQEFSSDKEALEWVIEEALTELGEAWKNDRKLRRFLFEVMSSDPTVLEDLHEEFRIENLHLCNDFCTFGN